MPAVRSRSAIGFHIIMPPGGWFMPLIKNNAGVDKKVEISLVVMYMIGVSDLLIR
jgi:hypothetical protein